MKDIPERAWLQVGEDLDLIDSFDEVRDEVTWAANDVHGNDIEYMRADLYTRLEEENERLAVRDMFLGALEQAGVDSWEGTQWRVDSFRMDRNTWSGGK